MAKKLGEETTDQIVNILLRIEKILERIEKRLEGEDRKEDFDPFILLELPDNLRSTFMALLRLKKATASDISSITGRGRAIESHYLNTLVRMGYVSKRRNGRLVYYMVKEK